LHCAIHASVAKTRAKMIAFATLLNLEVGLVIANELRLVGTYLVFGPVAHLVERFHGMEEAVGSIPIRSTTTPRLRCAQRRRGFSFIHHIHSLELNNFPNMIFTRLI